MKSFVELEQAPVTVDVLRFDPPTQLIPVVMQEGRTGRVLMVAYANTQAIIATLETRIATFWSRSRNELWIKGMQSGNVFHLVDVLVDCDADAVLYVVEHSAHHACHVGDEHGGYMKSCFYRSLSR